MKKIILSVFAIGVFTFSGLAQEGIVPGGASNVEIKQEGPSISVDKEVHDYGKIEKGANGDCFFTITNTGTEPLVITKAKGSCGCTVPKWPKEAIAPGKSAQMKVTYATNRVGRINKTVTITSNAKNTPVKVVKIAGEVLQPAPEDGAPVLTQPDAKPIMGN